MKEVQRFQQEVVHDLFCSVPGDGDVKTEADPPLQGKDSASDSSGFKIDTQ